MNFRAPLGVKRSFQIHFISLAAIAVSFLTSVGVLELDQRADRRSQARTIMYQIESKLYKLSALEWEAIAESEVYPETETEFYQTQRHIEECLSKLQVITGSHQALDSLVDLYEEYKQFTIQELRLVQAGKLQQAKEIDQELVNPVFQKIAENIDVLEDIYYLKSNQARTLSNIGILFILLLSSGVIIRLFWHFSHRLIHQAQSLKKAQAKLLQFNQALETKVKERTVALQERESRYRALVEVMPDLLIRIHRDGTYLDVISGEGVKPFNPEQTHKGSNVYRALPPEHAQQRMHYVQQALQTQTVQFYEYELLANGELRWEGARIIAINDMEVLAIIQDITARKQAEAQAKEMAQRLALATNSANIGIWDLDLVENQLRWDDLMYELYGLDPAEFAGTYEAWQKRIHPEDLSAAASEVEAAIAGGRDFHSEFKVLWPNDQVRVLEAHGIVLRDAKGFAQRMIGTNWDITARKQAEMQLQQTNEELIRATRLKDEFLANMSHELRTPLHAILGMAEGLQEGLLDSTITTEGQLKALQTIEQSGFHLLELINDILDIAKIESGQLDLDITPTAVASLCQSSLAFIKEQALMKRIQLDIQLSPRLPDISVDERRIRQVLINLLNNAVKFTPERGRITLQARHYKRSAQPNVPDSPSQSFLQIAVIDTGIGIAPEHIHMLFKPFIQIDSALNRQFMGTGLGLALVKRTIDLHGGQVRVDSEVGVGSCFTIDLPYGACTPSSSEATTHSEPSFDLSQANWAVSPTILLAEDNEANINTVANYLGAKGYAVLLAKNGQEAITLTQSENPDLILMDIQMPGLDGLEAIQKIRLDPNSAHVPIIALTGLAMTGDRERCLAAGADDYLSKPFKLKQLAVTIQKLLATSSH